MLKHFLNPPNWFTAASLFCGFYAILLAAGGADPQTFHRAGLLILFATAFDFLDGGVARLTGRGSRFGIELDSLSDAVSFGVAPALLVYFWGLHQLGWIGLAASFAFALCGVMRLARFNLEADGTKHAFSTGLTITAAGGTIATMVMAHAAMGRQVVAHPELPLALTILLSVLMVSTVPYRSFKAFRLRPYPKLLVGLGLACAIALAVVVDFSMWLFGAAMLYLAMGPIDGILQLRTRRLAAQAIELDDDTDF